MTKGFLKNILSFAFFALLVPVFGQITFENSYNFSGTYTDLKVSGQKFFLMDVGAKQCRIYNLNHSLWKTVNLTVPANHTLYDIKYVSENLFTNDNGLSLAYVYYYYDETNYYYTFYTKIIRENGTELLYIPGCMYLSIHQLSETDTRMLAFVYDYSVSPYTIQTRVYDLPGQLVSSIKEQVDPGLPAMSAFPNPSKEFVTIRYSLPSEADLGEIVIMDLQGKIIKSFPVSNIANKITINIAGIPKGTYLYFLRSGNYISKTESLVIQ